MELVHFNKEVFAAMPFNVFKKEWKAYEDDTGKSAEEAYKFFGGKAPAKKSK